MTYIGYDSSLKINIEEKDGSAMIKDHFIEKVQLQLELKEE